MNLFDALKGIGGQPEVNRIVGAFGVVSYVVCGNAFVAWNTIYGGHPFDVTAYCIAFPTGLGVAVGALAGAVSLKDRNVATAQVVRDTGGQPAAASPAGDAPAGTEADPLIVAGAPAGSPPVRTTPERKS